MIRRCLLVASALLAATGASRARQEAGEMFDNSNAIFDKKLAVAFATDLVEYAQGRVKASPEFALSVEYRKFVRLAYQLAPETPTVIAAHARIKKGLPVEAPKADVKAEKVMASLLAFGKATGNGPEDMKAAGFTYALGLMLDPANNACLVESEIITKRIGAPAWDKALVAYRREIPDGHTSSINGLVVMTAGGTTQVGQTSRILLTYRRDGKPSITVKFLREGGGMMVVSMDEAVRYWDRLRLTTPLPGGTIEISFEDKFTKKNGPSAGAAYAVLMRSFSDPFAVDPAWAMTGDVSVEGRVLQIGDAFAKIRGALQGKCARVGIPAANEPELTDAVILNGPQTLAEIEVYSIETVDHAVALARTDRHPDVEKVTSIFAGLLPVVKKKLEAKDPKEKAAKSPEVQAATDKILAIAPRHLSAKLLDLWNNGKLPATLSLSGSLEEASGTFYRYLVTISPGGQPSLAAIGLETKTTNVAATLKSLRELKPKLHADAAKSTQKLEETCSTIQTYIAAGPDVEEKAKRIETYSKKIDDYKFKIGKAKADGKPVEEINRLIKQHNEAVEDHKNAVDRHNKAVSDRNAVLERVGVQYNEYTTLIRGMSQDPRLLEKLIHGK